MFKIKLRNIKGIKKWIFLSLNEKGCMFSQALMAVVKLHCL